MTLEACEQEWNEAGQHGTPQERVARTKRWLPYYDYLAQKQIGRPYAPENGTDAYVSALADSGLLRMSDTVLDVGAGMGGYALELAQRCKSVTALEPSAACLSVLQDRALQRGAGNIRTVCDMWETFQPEEQYDLVFSSMCPAICNLEELGKMERMARRACCLITVMRGSADRHRRAMMQELGIRPKGGMVTEAIYYFNALYLMGRQPDVLCRTVHHAYDVDAKTVLEQYPIYFGIFGVDERTSLPYLKDYLEKNADGGVLHDESTIRQAMITWSTE